MKGRVGDVVIFEFNIFSTPSGISHYMAINFSDTLASINQDLNQRNLIFSILLAALLLIWFCWFFWVPLSITKQAKGSFDTGQSAIAITSAVDGRIERVGLVAGDFVNEGDFLIGINTEDEEKQIDVLQKALREEKLALKAIENSSASELQKLAIEHQSLAEKVKSLRAQLVNAQNQYDQQKSMVELLQAATSAISKIEIQKEQLQLQKIHEHLLIVQQSLKTVQSEQQQSIKQQELLEASFAENTARQQSRIASLQADLTAQQQHSAHKIMRAPKSAQVAEVMPLQEGQWITAGTTLATLVPEGELRVVAEFDPVDALGYLHVGQTAKIQVDNFPWLQYGALTARVLQVNQAARDGNIRVLLELTGKQHWVLQPGMTAKVIIDVAALTPWELLLQSLGQIRS
jgi:multidrug resistance efflux pump